MNVVHINQSDISGGAAIAGYRLHQGLLNAGVNSRLLVGNQHTSNENINTLSRDYRAENLIGRFTEPFSLNYINLINSFNIPKHKFFQDADIVNLHILHSNYFNYLALPTLGKHKPLVYTLHDMWSFTGHCAYSYDCDRWLNGCGSCPHLDSYPAMKRDNTKVEFKLKQWVYSHSNLHIVAPSVWLFELAQRSILKHFSIHHIPYGIDTQVYRPRDPSLSRTLLDIPNHKSVIMFAAQSLQDSRKGGDLLLKAIQCLPGSLKANIVLLTLGDGGESIAEATGLETINMGYTNSDLLKSIIYSSADLFVIPTRADNLPLVALESMACGTPIVSFDVGGLPDLVRPGTTGYLARSENYHDLAEGMVSLLQDPGIKDMMRSRCREIILKEYTLELQAARYQDLYQKILNR
jgi:glycosyltransferase involved in cell wall biosynthesis